MRLGRCATTHAPEAVVTGAMTDALPRGPADARAVPVPQQQLHRNQLDVRRQPMELHHEPRWPCWTAATRLPPDFQAEPSGGRTPERRGVMVRLVEQCPRVLELPSFLACPWYAMRNLVVAGVMRAR